MNKAQTPPHVRLSPREASDKLQHWAGIMLGSPTNNLGFSWIEVQRRMVEARWLGHEPLVDALLMAEVVREQDWLFERKIIDEAVKSGLVFNARDIPRGIIEAANVRPVRMQDGDGRIWFGVILTPDFWWSYGRECYQNAVALIGENHDHWRAVAARIWDLLPPETQESFMREEP